METKEKDELSYIAFISYRHRPLDREAAIKVQRRIESYVVPKALRKDPSKKKLGKVFRDEDELPVSSSLSASITYALDHTEYLIVICTPDLPLSKWCEEEIRYFTTTHDRDHVIGVLADGTPDVSFSPYMLHTFDEKGNFLEEVEPLAANIAGKDHTIDRKMFNKEIYRIYAALIGCRFDELWQRERRAKTRRATILLGSVAAALTVFSTFMLLQNAKIRRQSKQISRQNGVISQQNDDLKQSLSSIEVDRGNSRLAAHWVGEALSSGVNAVEAGGPAYNRGAEKLLADALGAYDNCEYRSEVGYHQTEHIADLEVTDDCRYSFLLDSIGCITCVDNEIGEAKWRYLTPDNAEIDIGGYGMEVYGTLKQYGELLPVRNNGILLYKDYVRVVALSTEDGSVRWQHDYKTHDAYYGPVTDLESNAFRGLSADGTRLALIDRETEAGVDLLVLDTDTGAEVARTHLDTEISEYASFWYLTGASFTEDNAYLSAAFFDGERFRFFTVDARTGAMVREHVFDDEKTKLHNDMIVYGLRYDPETEELFSAILAPRKGGIAVFVFHPDGEMTYELHTAAIRTQIGKFYETTEYANFINTMLTIEDTAVIFNDASALFVDVHTGQLINSVDLSGRIIDTFCVDNRVAILTDGGAVNAYTLNDGGITRGFTWPTDCSGLLLGKLNRTGFEWTAGDTEEIQVVSVASDQDNALLRTDRHTDPDLETLALETPDEASVSCAAFSPSGERIFVFSELSSYDSADGEAKLIVSVYSTADRAPVGFVTVPYLYGSTPAAVDDEHFVCGTEIYALDGSSVGLEGVNAENEGDLETSDGSSYVLKNGDVLTVEKFSSDDTFTCWINGKAMGKLPWPEEHMLPLTDCSCGGSGLLMNYDPAGAFLFFDPAAGKETRVEIPDAEELKDVIMGQAGPAFAFRYTNGNLMVGDAEAETCRLLAELPEDERIVAWTFTQDDRFLVLMTEGKRFDGYDCETGTRVFSVNVENAPKTPAHGSLRMRCVADDEGKRFDFTVQTSGSYSSDASKRLWARIDAEQNLILQSYNGVVGYAPSQEALLSATNKQVTACKVHPLAELIANAKQRIGTASDETAAPDAAAEP